MGVPNTHKVHCVQALGVNTIKVADTSSEMEMCSRVCRIRNENCAPVGTSTSQQDLVVENSIEQQAMNLIIRQWVIVSYEGEEFPGEVTGMEDSDVEVNIMHRSAANWWKWPKPEDKIFYSRDEEVHLINPSTVAGNRGQFVFSCFIIVCLDFKHMYILITFFRSVHPSQVFRMSIPNFNEDLINPTIM